VNALVALATGEGEDAWVAVVDALPTLPRQPQVSLATALARRAATHPSPALTRCLSWLLTAGPELEAVGFAHLGPGALELRPRPPFGLAPVTQWRHCRQVSFASEDALRFIVHPDGSNAVELFTRSVGGAPFGQTPIATIEPSGRYRDDGTLAVERPSEDRSAYDAHGYLGEIEVVETGQRSVLPARSTHVAWTGKSLSAVALSPDGARIVAASHDGELGVFDAATGTMQARLVREPRSGTAMLLALDDPATRLVAGTTDARLEVWSPATGARIAEIEVAGPPSASPSHRTVISSPRDSRTARWRSGPSPARGCSRARAACRTRPPPSRSARAPGSSRRLARVRTRASGISRW